MYRWRCTKMSKVQNWTKLRYILTRCLILLQTLQWEPQCCSPKSAPGRLICQDCSQCSTLPLWSACTDQDGWWLPATTTIHSPSLTLTSNNQSCNLTLTHTVHAGFSLNTDKCYHESWCSPDKYYSNSRLTTCQLVPQPHDLPLVN